jgi:hypothetical protein
VPTRATSVANWGSAPVTVRSDDAGAALRVGGVAEFLTDTSPRSVLVWLALTFAVFIAYTVPVVRAQAGSDLLVQDDARQHVFWMARFLDPGQFPGDPIADYFQSVAPSGYTAVYRAFAALGVAPLSLSYVLPFALALLTALGCFFLSLRILPVPFAAFLSTAMLTQNVWTTPDIVSATPRAFAYPIMVAFLYGVARGSLTLSLAAVVLEGLFYPQYTLLAAGVLALRPIRWQEGGLRLTRERSDWLFSVAGLTGACVVLLPYVLHPNPYGPVIGAAEARALPEFQPLGRSAFFFPDAALFWLFNPRGGFIPFEWVQAPIPPPQALLWLLLPLALFWRRHCPLTRRIGGATAVVPLLLLAGTGMFALAHSVLFTMHLPGRYSQFSLRVALALAAAAGLVMALDGLSRWATCHGRLARAAVGVLAISLVLWVLLYPLPLRSVGGAYPNTDYLRGREPDLYAFLARQPKDALVASLDRAVDHIPTFAHRSILVGSEYAVPYHLGYYRPFRQRTVELIQAQYSPDLAAIQQLIRQYNVDLLLLDRAWWTAEYVERNDWIMQFESETGTLAGLRAGQRPALRDVARRCRVARGEESDLFGAQCLLDARP